jgi:hypothetical protein
MKMKLIFLLKMGTYHAQAQAQFFFITFLSVWCQVQWSEAFFQLYFLPAHCLDITAGGVLVQHASWSGGCVEYG